MWSRPPPPTSAFRASSTLQQRQVESRRVLKAHPHHVPVLVEPVDDRAPAIDKKKFLVPRDFTAAQLAFAVRRRMRMGATQALFLHCDGCLLTGETVLGGLCDAHRNEDGFLYVHYALENAFGG